MSFSSCSQRVPLREVVDENLHLECIEFQHVSFTVRHENMLCELHPVRGRKANHMAICRKTVEDHTIMPSKFWVRARGALSKSHDICSIPGNSGTIKNDVLIKKVDGQMAKGVMVSRVASQPVEMLKY